MKRRPPRPEASNRSGTSPAACEIFGSLASRLGRPGTTPANPYSRNIGRSRKRIYRMSKPDIVIVRRRNGCRVRSRQLSHLSCLRKRNSSYSGMPKPSAKCISPVPGGIYCARWCSVGTVDWAVCVSRKKANPPPPPTSIRNVKGNNP